jgi:hypothetical protein
MRLVQCDGFAVYAGKGAQNSQGAAPRRPAPVARSSSRAVKRRATVSTGTRVARQSPTWNLALQSAVFAAILMGLFGAYSLGRFAATSGPRAGLVYTRPVVAEPAPSADAVTERLSLNTYIR